MVNGGTGEIGTDRDRLEGGSVVAEFAEDFASRLYDALTRFSGLRCGGATWTSTRGMLRHGQIVPQLTYRLGGWPNLITSRGLSSKFCRSFWPTPRSPACR